MASSAVGGTLMPPFQFGDGGPGGWWIFDEPELHLGADVLVPDLAGWRVARMPDPPSEAFFTLAPDFVCEVLSPSTARIDRVRKMPIYARAGVEHAWLVDPAARTLEVFRLERGRWLVLGAYDGDALVRAEPFEAIELELARFWGMKREAAPPE
jgi:Uma2 family endonuclease